MVQLCGQGDTSTAHLELICGLNNLRGAAVNSMLVDFAPQVLVVDDPTPHGNFELQVDFLERSVATEAGGLIPVDGVETLTDVGIDGHARPFIGGCDPA